MISSLSGYNDSANSTIVAVVCACVCVCGGGGGGSCLATKVLIGDLPATGREWVI